MARKFSLGFVFKNLRAKKWRMAISWQDDDGKQHKMTRSTSVRCYPDKVGKYGRITKDNRGKVAAEQFLRE